MKKKIIYAFISLAVVAAAFIFSGFLINTKSEPKKNDNKHNIIFVKATKAQSVKIDSDMDYRGRVSAFDNISLASEVTGRIIKGDVQFKTGEHFRKNQRLLSIYSKDVEAALKSGKSSFLQTLSKILPDLKVDYNLEYEKWLQFFNEVDPEKPLPKLPSINSEKEKVFLASNNVLTSYYSLQQQEINLRRYAIYAPFNGSFKAVNKEIGAVASPGAELAKLIRSDKLEIITPVFPSDLKWIKIGDKVQLYKNNGAMQTATISRIADFVDEATQSVNVYLTFYATSKNRFLEGEYVDVKFSGGTINGFQLPREAIVDKSFVYELKNNKLSKIKVDIQRQLDDQVIISGIDSEKVIVTESLSAINNNADYQARQ